MSIQARVKEREEGGREETRKKLKQVLSEYTKIRTGLFQMSSDSDSDCSLSGLRRVQSGPKIHSNVPADLEFIFKVKTVDKAKRMVFAYTLKHGRRLPYEAEIEGLCPMLCIKKNLYLRIQSTVWG